MGMLEVQLVVLACRFTVSPRGNHVFVANLYRCCRLRPSRRHHLRSNYSSSTNSSRCRLCSRLSHRAPLQQKSSHGIQGPDTIDSVTESVPGITSLHAVGGMRSTNVWDGVVGSLASRCHMASYPTVNEADDSCTCRFGHFQLICFFTLKSTFVPNFAFSW